MLVCARCARENPDDARFCNACGAPLAVEPRAREERKVVTAVFVDLVGSTARAEQLDPEDVRALLRRYHETLRRDLERYGGTVEKFIGDAVVAVYGAPTAHEVTRSDTYALGSVPSGGTRPLAQTSTPERGAICPPWAATAAGSCADGTAKTTRSCRDGSSSDARSTLTPAGSSMPCLPDA